MTEPVADQNENAPHDIEGALGRLFALGYDHVEIEVTEQWASAFGWRPFRRGDGFAAGDYTLKGALNALVKRAERMSEPPTMEELTTDG